MINEMLSFISNNTSNATGGTPTPVQQSVSIIYGSVGSFLFPFLLVFAIVYGVLERTKVLTDKRDINSIVAFVLGIVAATTNYFLKLAYTVLPIVAVVIVVVFMLMVISSTIYGGEIKTMPASARKLITVVAVIIALALIIYIFATPNDNFNFAGISNSSAVNVITASLPYIAVLVFLILAAYVLLK